MDSSENREVATLAGGCFWCLDAVFEQLRGVERIVPGYAGGHVPDPSYYQVCTGTTGHAEAVQITFDPKVITYRDLLKVFFSMHDPTTLNRQGHDVGTQYRSAIFYHTLEQKKTSEDEIRNLKESRIWKQGIVTTVQPIDAFYPAEEYHHHYFRKNPDQAYCQIVITPKLAKLREGFLARLK
ncbi:MAG: peptide-methionine (S)-S-oxide reductase MsrA [Dehalococcoidia bacterium]|nr:peptide-methionine (S)-S-oxide reductase MsrA [Dehalococcoidia bacterium]